MRVYGDSKLEEKIINKIVEIIGDVNFIYDGKKAINLLGNMHEWEEGYAITVHKSLKDLASILKRTETYPSYFKFINDFNEKHSTNFSSLGNPDSLTSDICIMYKNKGGSVDKLYIEINANYTHKALTTKKRDAIKKFILEKNGYIEDEKFFVVDENTQESWMDIFIGDAIEKLKA